MPSIVDIAAAPAKIVLVGKSGAGKTGSLASLVAAGYNLRILDTDNGVKVLHNLLTDSHYPYAKIIRQREIDLAKAVHFIPISTEMRLRHISRKLPNDKVIIEKLLAPASAEAWTTMLDKLDQWKDGETDYGPVRSWDTSSVLVIDSFSTLAMCAYYFNQQLNGRLGAREEGYDYQRDIGGAQAQLRRLLELLFDSSIACNVVLITHITWVDDSQGVASRPRVADADGNFILSKADGYPSAIGRALSPKIGIYFNDTYIARSNGSGLNVNRTISTVPQEGVLTKNSAYLEREYPVGHGLASIFAALRHQDPPADLLEAYKTKPTPTFKIG